MRSPRPDLGDLHPHNDAIVGIYLVGKEQAMHRRAQAAEGDITRLMRINAALLDEIERLGRTLITQRNREKAQRQRANRLHKFVDEVERLRREREPLERIIELGKLFP